MARTRFALSPVWEIVTSNRLLRSDQEHPLHRRWTAQRINSLFADYAPDEIAVLADWFTRARGVLRESLDEIREATDPGKPDGAS
jgi:hypothetical protein